MFLTWIPLNHEVFVDLNVKYVKWLWIAALIIFIGYFINDYLESGFNSQLFAVGVGLAASGVGFLKKK